MKNRDQTKAEQKKEADAFFKEAEKTYEQKDYHTALSLYQKAADRGHIPALFDLGWMHCYGKGTVSDEKKGVGLVRQAAKQGVSKAQFFLGKWHYHGNHVIQDYRTAKKFFKQAAAQGLAQAQFHLSEMYAGGLGTKKNEKKAVEMVSKSAAQGNEDAMFELAFRYREGRGFGRDEQKVVELLQQAADKGKVESIRLEAEQGYVYAQVSLGILNEMGYTMKQNPEEAFRLFEQAAQQGDKDGIFDLGLMYRKGQGVQQDDQEAIQLFRQAARQGHEKSVRLLLSMYKEEGNQSTELIFGLAILSTEKQFKKLIRQEIDLRPLKAKLTERARLDFQAQPYAEITEDNYAVPSLILLVNESPENLAKLKKCAPQVYNMYQQYKSHFVPVGQAFKTGIQLPAPLQRLIIDQLLPAPLNQMTRESIPVEDRRWSLPFGMGKR